MVMWFQVSNPTVGGRIWSSLAVLESLNGRDIYQGRWNVEKLGGGDGMEGVENQDAHGVG
jgi:hypothetical protein